MSYHGCLMTCKTLISLKVFPHPWFFVKISSGNKIEKAESRSELNFKIMGSVVYFEVLH